MLLFLSASPDLEASNQISVSNSNSAVGDGCFYRLAVKTGSIALQTFFVLHFELSCSFGSYLLSTCVSEEIMRSARDPFLFNIFKKNGKKMFTRILVKSIGLCQLLNFYEIFRNYSFLSLVTQVLDFFKPLVQLFSMFFCNIV